MLRRIVLTDFRCFSKHEIIFKSQTIFVGRYSAGKYSLIRALRLIAKAVAGYPNLRFSDPPHFSNLPRRHRIIRPSLNGVDLDFDTLFFRYDPDVASISCEFESGLKCELRVFKDRTLFGILSGPQGEVVADRRTASHFNVEPVRICPELAPLQKSERMLSNDYVMDHLETRLGSLHFRNQLLLFPDRLALLRSIVEESWPGLKLGELTTEFKEDGKQYLFLMVRDGDFFTEIGAMGHGLQMWIQTIWFLTSCSPQDTVILDEPDVYMHPDLQHRLMKTLSVYRQS